MPRINIEEKWFSDLRRTMLVSKLGDEAKADGALLWAVKLAQQYWLPNKGLIPLKTWQGCSMPDALIDVGLAEIREDGIYVSGSEEHFEWWFKKQDAGKKGGLARASNAKQTQADPSRPKQVQPSSSSSSSSSLGIGNAYTKNDLPCSIPETKKKKQKASPEALSARATLKDVWLKSYKARFGHDYVGSDSAYFNTLIKRLHGALGQTKATELMKLYIAWDEPYIARNGHPLHMLLPNMHSLEAHRHREADVYQSVARGKARQRVLTETEQRLEEMKSYAKQQQQPTTINYGDCEPSGFEIPERSEV